MKRIAKAPDERRTELIEAAQKLFYEQGYERTSVKDIVNAVGVAKGLFYYYFESKAAVLTAIADEMQEQAMAFMRPIVADETLNAIPKWNQAFSIVNSWKLARKDEMIAMVRLLQSDQNVLLRTKLQERSLALLAPELAMIIVQGVREGVFDTPFGAESAAIVLGIFQTVRNPLTDVLLNPADYDDPAQTMWREITAVQTAIERVLGAAAGTLPLADFATIQAWFEE